MPAFNWTQSPVLSGTPLTVTVTGSPCQPVSVKLIVGGNVVGKLTIPSPPGEVTFSVPGGTTGAAYRIELSCDNGQGDVHAGVVG
jgi:hypothetical protein